MGGQLRLVVGGPACASRSALQRLVDADVIENDVNDAVARSAALVTSPVTDSGVGLSPAEISNLFTKFYRARNPVTWDVPGIGLGLAIARAFIERPGGSISVASEPGEGSTFGAWLPLGRAQH